MENSLFSRMKHAWNIFTKGEQDNVYRDIGSSYSVNPGRHRMRPGNEQSILNAVCNRIAIDVSSVDIRHVMIDDEGRYIYEVNDGLNNCLSLEANMDQTGRAFIRDIVSSMLDEGVVAVVPIDTQTKNGFTSRDILTMRTGKIVQWYPAHVKVDLYNDRTGQHEQITVPKHDVAIIENPLYSVMNEKNSILQRLIRKLNLLDIVDEQASSGKLDLIIQLPYVIKTDARRKQAEERRQNIEDQLKNTKYGIAYTDGTEHITQLNRPVENNLMKQIEFLFGMFYSQLGVTKEVLEGTASESAMLNYNNRTIEPILSEIVDNFKRSFLTKTARSQHHSILYFRDPFKLAPISQIAEIADKFTRNEVLSPNEVRQIIGRKPSKDPNSDKLSNRNIGQKNLPEQMLPQEPANEDEQEAVQNGEENV